MCLRQPEAPRFTKEPQQTLVLSTLTLKSSGTLETPKPKWIHIHSSHGVTSDLTKIERYRLTSEEGMSE